MDKSTFAESVLGAMECNLRRYRHLQRVAGALFWLPTSVLYFVDRFGLGDALRLQAVYYLAVVAFEVPSGWFSDRIGRVVTLRLGALWWVGAFGLFMLSDEFVVVTAAQVLLAMGFAFASGTDVTLHYDSLEALGRTAEFEIREAKARRDHLLVTALAVVAGGALGLVDLRLPFLASLVAAVIQLAVSFGLVEPMGASHSTGAGRDLLKVVAHLRDRTLAWVMVYVLGEVITAHLTSELAAPYVVGVVGETLQQIDRAPVVNGLLAAAIATTAAVVVGGVGRARNRFGLVAVFVAVAAIPAFTLSAMAVATSAFVLPLIVLRSVQTACVAVLVPATVAPRVDRAHRATFLSLTSLVGRLGYGLVLLSIGSVGDLAETLRWAAVIALVVLVVVASTSRLVASNGLSDATTA